ncbi:hypothetical protein D3C81_1750320 [compost metagenome]
MHLVDQHRIAFLGDKQTLAHRIIGQPLKPLVAAHVHAEGHLFGICRIEERHARFQVNLDQSLLAFVRDDIGVVADELHGFRIAETDQRNAPQDLAIKG